MISTWNFKLHNETFNLALDSKPIRESGVSKYILLPLTHIFGACDQQTVVDFIKKPRFLLSGGDMRNFIMELLTGLQSNDTFPLL